MSKKGACFSIKDIKQFVEDNLDISDEKEGFGPQKIGQIYMLLCLGTMEVT